MATAPRILSRNLQELGRDVADWGLEDPDGIAMLPPCRQQALAANPMAEGGGTAAQTLGLVGNRVVGQHTVFPINIRAFGQFFLAWTGSGLFLHEAYRKSGLAIPLIEGAESVVGKIDLGCGLSRISVPLHLMLDYACFPMKRLLWLARSRPVVSKFLGSNWLARATAVLGDALLGLPNALLRIVVAVQARRLRVERLVKATPEVAEMAAATSRSCACVHSEAWFNWLLNHTFSPDARSRQKLFLVRDRNDRPLGFFFVKVRFHATASHRGFSNVLLGSLLEWQSIDERRLSHGLLARLAARELLREGVDAIEICTDEEAMLKSLKRSGFRPLGDLWFVVRARENHPLHQMPDFIKQENWRLRPCEGDNGLS